MKAEVKVIDILRNRGLIKSGTPYPTRGIGRARDLTGCAFPRSVIPPLRLTACDEPIDADRFVGPAGGVEVVGEPESLRDSDRVGI